MENKYTKEYFIAKFEAIPDEKWAVGNFAEEGCFCAFGHCGTREVDGREESTPEADALSALFRPKTPSYLAEINDGENQRFNQDTPKARVLAALAAL